MLRPVVALFAAALLIAALAGPAGAITFGQPDGNRHPNVGSIVLAIPEIGLIQWCSGTLIADDVFLTASHCTAPLNSIVQDFGAQVLITFDASISVSGTFFTGTWVTHPLYSDFRGKHGNSDPHDIAVVLLDQSPGLTPASLPTVNMLDQLKADGTLRRTRFTAVGYGAVRESMQTGFQAIQANVDRNFSEQGFNSLTKAWLTLPMTNTPGRDNGGTCYGDSGGPHFIHLNTTGDGHRRFDNRHGRRPLPRRRTGRTAPIPSQPAASWGSMSSCPSSQMRPPRGPSGRYMAMLAVSPARP